MNQLPKLLSEIAASARLIPAGYRWPLALMALLVVSLVVAIVLVSPTALPPAAPPAVVVATPSPPVSATGDPVKDLFDPNTAQTAEQQRETAALAQIDNILLTSYLLTKCNKMKPEEYNDTYQLLLTYAKLQRLVLTIEAADVLVRERAKAAAGSYELVYSRVNCSDIGKEKLAADLDLWRRNTRLAPIRQ